MGDAAQLLDFFRAHLVAQGLARNPSQAGDAPPLWLHPQGGAVAPGDKAGAEDAKDLVLSAFIGGGVAPRPYESDRRTDLVDVFYRARLAPFALEHEERLRAELVGDLGRYQWNMAGMLITATLVWSSIAPLANVEGPGHTFIGSFLFEHPSTLP